MTQSNSFMENPTQFNFKAIRHFYLAKIGAIFNASEHIQSSSVALK